MNKQDMISAIRKKRMIAEIRAKRVEAEQAATKPEQAATEPEPSALDPTTWPIVQALRGNTDQALEGAGAFASGALNNILETASNVPSSAVKYGEDMVYPVMHPQETVESLSNLGSGLLHKTPFYPGVQDDEKYPDAVGNMLADRYGGIGAIGNTARTDPVGLLGDVAGLLSGVGMVPKLSKLAAAGRSIDPANLAVKLPAKLSGLGANIPRDLYARAAKLSTTIPINRRNELLQQLVDDGIPLTTKGVNKNISNVAKSERDLIGSVNKAMNPVGQLPHPGIDAALTFKKAEDYVGAMHPEKTANMVTTPGDIKAARTTLDFLKQWREASGKPVMSLLDVLENKRNAYERIDWREGNKKKARNQVYKRIAQADKEILEANVPGIKERNAQFGRRLEVRKPLEKSAERIANTQLLSLSNLLTSASGGLIAGATTGSLTHILGGLLGGAAVSQLNSPRFVTGLARGLNAVGNNRVARGARNMPLDPGLIPALISQINLQSGRLAQSQSDDKDR